MVVIGPDENGNKKVIEHRFDNAGNKVKVITTTTITRKLVRVRLGSSRSVIERRSWPKFGDATNDTTGSRFTMRSPDEILLERPPRAPPGRPSNADVVPGCRICGNSGDHWTAKCPRRCPAPQEYPLQTPPITPRRKKLDPLQEAHPLSFMMGTSDRIRDRLMKLIGDDRCVRVTNISEETYEVNLIDLFSFFGFILWVYVHVDTETGLGRGVGFVKFGQRREAEAAIERLNGRHTNNGVVLQVEWAAPWLKGALPVSPIPTRATDEYRVRVTNLSEDIHEYDLFELFGRFGMVTYAHVAVDKKSGLNKGFGFVNFAQRHEAENAIRVVNGHTYNLVLGVGWEHQDQENLN
ncbi:hypothetical protein HU200_002147 [Digitaria exilis]|uniref:RRM domain-containing protein n=1 Tax=Digitaria exilis TaxID=1010633 RepID=A0A835FW74_9POAL|nr:hypothetical protein HU200_002147 [Digitaria exilis]CAB3448045.1 unnamed protein product [Digitaria exilis]